MESGFLKGQSVILCIENGRDAQEYPTSILRVSGQELILKQPEDLENGLGMQVTVRSRGKGAFSAEGEIQESVHGKIKVRCFDLSPTEEQRRELVRQTDELPIRFRVISSHEHELRQSHFALEATSFTPSRRLSSKSSSESPEDTEWLVLECLREIKLKLDRLIEVMTLRVGEAQPDYSGVVKDISGSGLRFESDQPLDEGAFLEFKIALPGRDGGFFSSLAEVKRVTEALSSDGKKCWIVAVHFTAISESDQDRVVAYVLARERTSLKNQ